MKEDLTHKNAELKALLQSVRNAKRVYRDQATDEILRRPELLPHLVYAVFETGNDQIKAAWILELVCLYEPRLLIPFVPKISRNLLLLNNESSIRPVSKVCSLITGLYFKDPWSPFDTDAKWIQGMVEASFEWLTGEHKVAARVFAMETLYFWGLKIEWIHGELISFLERDFAKESAAYQSRARKIMDKITSQKP